VPFVLLLGKSVEVIAVVGARSALVETRTEGKSPMPTPRHVAMTWARRLKRVFGIEIEACTRCGGKLAIIASIEEPEVIARILAHLETAAADQFQAELPRGARAPPSQARLL